MNLEVIIAEVEAQVDLTLMSDDGWFSRFDYSFLAKSPKNPKSRYGLIHDILHHGADGKRIIDKINKNNLNYIYEKCMDYIDNHQVRDHPGGFSNRGIGWNEK